MSISYGGDNIQDTDGGVLRPSSSVMRNRIINGSMTIDQRNAGASVTPTASGYTLDRWRYGVSSASKCTIQQNAGSVTPPVGFVNYLGLTSTSAYAVGSAEANALSQKIEGYNIADLGWGTANAKTVTLSFWVYSSLTGTFGGSLRGASTVRSYPFTYSISAANTWTNIVITIAGDSSGTWNTTNGTGVEVTWGVGVGSTYSGTAGAWATADYRSASGTINILGTSGATFYLTGVQLEVGSSATGFEYRQYGQELALCQRYFYTDKPNANAVGICSGVCFTATGPIYAYRYPVPMRSSPTFTYSSLSDFGVIYGGAVSGPTSMGVSSSGTTSGRLDLVSNVVQGQGTVLQTTGTSSALNFSAEL